MIINVSFKHMDTSDALRTYVEEKSERLKKYFDGKIHCTWNFSIENLDKVAHCHLLGNHMDFFGEARTGDFHSSIDETLDKMERQIRKRKEIVKSHHHADARKEKAAKAALVATETAEALEE